LRGHFKSRQIRTQDALALTGEASFDLDRYEHFSYLVDSRWERRLSVAPLKAIVGFSLYHSFLSPEYLDQAAAGICSFPPACLRLFVLASLGSRCVEEVTVAVPDGGTLKRKEAPMAERTSGSKFVPGTYAKPRPSAPELANRYIREWDEKHRGTKAKETAAVACPPTICISRKLGSGAVEIAELVAEKIGYRVVDQQILQHIATNASLSEKTVAIFDERYPGKISELVTLAFGEKAFIKSDYAKHLFSSVYAIAALGPTIFVGRGVHLLLSREKVFAVRIISSEQFRVQRLVSLMNISKEEAAKQISELDRQQAAFFKEVFNKKDASPYEFDMVINCDYIKEPRSAAEIILSAFRTKFGVSETRGR
jgi:cytidylate kinase